MTARKASKPVAKPVHGTYSTYTNWSCRCEKCRAAAALRQREVRARRAARLNGAA